jgi:tRNA/tmRNA/rRNA uracil-C5-methylase (TrmA/RlmC/RlmD family)
MELGTSGKTKVGKLIYGGYGLGKREDGSAVFIPNVVPGEIVEYEIDGSQGGIPVGRVVRIVDKSEKRRDMPCEYAGECGGCDWGHLEYDEQVRRKKEIFLDCIDRIGKFDRPQDIEIFTAAEFGYRMRAQAKVDHQNKSVGFYRKKTNEVIKVIKCPLLVDEINDVLAKLNFGMMSGISNDVKTIKILAGDGVASYPVINGLTGAKTEVGVDGVRFLVDGGSFFQSNRYLLKALGRWAGGIINGKTCFDLYGGIGFFSMMLADNFTNIILVENIAAQVRAAERNF